MIDRVLVVLTGPVGAGKSTTGLALAQRLRSSGRATAVIDLDQVYSMARQRDGFGEPDAWEAARRAAAALAESFFASGNPIVVVEGEFFTPEELRQLTDALHTEVERHFFTLRVSYAETLRRIRGDTGRGASADPKLLEWLHGNFHSALTYLGQASIVVDGELRSPEELAAWLAQSVLGGARRGRA